MSDLNLGAIGQIAYKVRDVEQATEFFRDKLGATYLFGFPGMAFFDCGGVRLYLGRPEGEMSAENSILYFRVDDIESAAAVLRERGVSFVEEPRKVHEDERHELWIGFFKDPEDNLLALMSEVPK